MEKEINTEEFLNNYFDYHYYLKFDPNEKVIKNKANNIFTFDFKFLDKIKNKDKNFICFYKAEEISNGGKKSVYYSYLFKAKNNQVFEYNFNITDLKSKKFKYEPRIYVFDNEFDMVDGFEFNLESKIINDRLNNLLYEDSFETIEFIKNFIIDENNLRIWCLLNTNIFSLKKGEAI